MAVLLLAAGCRDDDADARDERSDEPTRLVVTTADGTERTLTDVTATCIPSDYDPKVQVVRVSGELDGGGVFAEVLPADVEGGRSYDMPVPAGSDETGPENAIVVVGIEPDLTNTSEQEESTGTLEVLRASCDPVEVELTIDGTLDSEYYDGEPVDVEGRLVFPAPAG
ncbi:hypothetical protein CFH99_06215 [Nocardioides aromaticivorans]|uniref:Lipoprotein n=1 Tax=Nocardioides aromaticivorans TaxID=200618 RepID=A0ABX7PHG8_9ACTN|nr:hypothetical protein CFH99_06215 [Nocardioides aromaticivorans]